MEANELMIGDWVRMHYPFDMDIDMRPERINVLAKGVDIDCEPIPLTTEIFEKNGFIGKEEGHYYSYHRYGRLGNEIFNVHYQNHWIACSTPDNRDEFALFGMIILRYVHELQHALRLCGLNNLADNLIV